MDSAGARTMWKGKRVFLTGHTGFKGAWLTRWLLRLGADVTGFSLAQPVTDPALFDLARLHSDLASDIRGDVRSYEDLLAALHKSQPAVVFHLAAQALVRAGYRDPIVTYATNVMGTVHLLEAARQTPSVRAIVICTTDKCYENDQPNHRPFVETDPLGGYDPYSSSKASAELVVASYRRSFLGRPDGAQVASVRAGNVIGGGDFSADRLIPDLVRHWQMGQATPIRNPDAIRPWQHVLDPLRGYLTVAERLLSGEGAEAWNFGPDGADARPVSWVADRFCASLGGGQWSHDRGDHPHEAPTLRLDCAKAMARLGWRPRWGLETGLRRTGEWYRGQRDGTDAPALMDADIDAYESASPFAATQAR